MTTTTLDTRGGVVQGGIDVFTATLVASSFSSLGFRCFSSRSIAIDHVRLLDRFEGHDRDQVLHTDESHYHLQHVQGDLNPQDGGGEEMQQAVLLLGVHLGRLGQLVGKDKVAPESLR